MKKLLFKTFLFTLPFLGVLSYPLMVMQVSGELVPADKILIYQNLSSGPCLILPAYSDPWSYVKLQSVKNRHPDIIAVGSSRVMQFRSKFFQASFYNASRGISDVKHLKEFLVQIPNPKIIILGLDPNMLNPNWTFSSTEEMYRKPTWEDWLRILGKNWSGLYRDQFAGKIHLREIFDGGHTVRKIGLTARAEENGFVNDGSFFYGNYMRLSAQTWRQKRGSRVNAAMHQIDEGKGIYVPGNEVSEEKMILLEDFLKEAAKRKIHVVAYLPPFAPAIYQELLSNKQRFQYLWKLQAALEPLFHKYGHQIFDFQDPLKLAAKEEDFVDDVHDAGRVTLNVFLEMAQRDRQLKQDMQPSLSQLKNQDPRLISNFLLKT